MNCSAVQKYLDAPTAPENAAFLTHLATCADCTAKVESWKKFSAQFREATAPMLAAPTQGEVRRLMDKVERPQRRVLWPMFVTAGAVAAALILFVVLKPAPTEPELPATIDGIALVNPHLESNDTVRTLEVSAAKIELAKNSSVKLTKRTAKSVRVELDRGAVSLAVAHRAPDQSFTVVAAGWEAHVVGTQFSVKRENEKVEVHVTEGQVRVTSTAPAGEPAGLFDGRGFDVRAGQTFRSDDAKVIDDPPAKQPEPEPLPPEPEPEPELDTRWTPSAKDNKDLERWKKSPGQCSKHIVEVRGRLAKTPSWSAAWKVLADCQRLTSATDDAIVSYTRLITLSKRDDADRARLLIADLLQQKNEHARAEKTLREYLAHKQPPELEASARVRLAKSLLALGKKKEAKTELDYVMKKLSNTSAAIQALELSNANP
ncbi:MAG: tetratricopeptide repeat protein [Archangium sp.]|nr:tetratricopeptide repeat protein [Archangium sp.]